MSPAARKESGRRSQLTQSKSSRSTDESLLRRLRQMGFEIRDDEVGRSTFVDSDYEVTD